jgi:hypothetical protein
MSITTWLVFPDAANYAAAVEMCAASPIEFDDKLALFGFGCENVLTHEGEPTPERAALYVVSLDRALDAVRQLRRKHLVQRSKPRGYEYAMRRQRRRSK